MAVGRSVIENSVAVVDPMALRAGMTSHLPKNSRMWPEITRSAEEAAA